MMEEAGRLWKRGLAFRDGAKAGIPVAIGYLPIAVTFGLLAKSAGVPDWTGALMSFLVFAGASQFVGVNLLAVGASYWEIVLTTFVLNLRHFLMTASLARRIEPGTSRAWMALLAFGVTDETFSVASLRQEQTLSPSFVLGLNLTAFLAWNAGTWAGLWAGAGLSPSLQASMGIALYAMFIGLLVPALQTSRPVLTVVLLGAAVHGCLRWLPVFQGLSDGWGIVAATVLAAAAGAVWFPEEGDA